MPAPIRLRFNKTSLENVTLPAPGKRLTYYDTEVPGLQLRVTHRGAKSFCVFRRSKRGKPERVTIGPFPTLSVERARLRAKRHLADLGDGISISAQRRNAKAEAKTLGDVHEEYLASRGVMIEMLKRKDGRLIERPCLGANSKIKPLTARDYVKIMVRSFPTGAQSPLSASIAI